MIFRCGAEQPQELQLGSFECSVRHVVEKPDFDPLGTGTVQSHLRLPVKIVFSRMDAAPARSFVDKNRHVRSKSEIYSAASAPNPKSAHIVLQPRLRTSGS